MHAVEFESSIKNGMIEVPENYKDLQEVHSVRLVVMYDLDKKSDDIKNDAKMSLKAIDNVFDKFQVNLLDYKFDRDEANER